MPAGGEPDTQVLDMDSDGVTLRARKIRVAVVSGPGAGQRAELPGPEVRIGSGTGNHLVLADAAVSRHHLTLRHETSAIRVIDEGSRNGTFLDGTRIRDAYARPDSVIRVGNTTLQLSVLRDVVTLPLSTRARFGGLVGRSVPMRQLFTLLERIAPTEDTVLVEGETGTGKELVAEAIHEESERAPGPFVVFDCSAVSEGVLESELFGHVRGAFTGAVADRLGAFEAADGGTLFLDEIGELPIQLQPKLLRAIERGEIRSVGNTNPRHVDVRIVAATNRNLAEEVSRGRFREDLFYRIAVVTIRTPPLRERLDDVPLLVDHFVQQLRRGRSDAHVADSVVRSFSAQAWPGNVRELRNAVARSLSLGQFAHSETAPQPAYMGEVDLSVPLKVARDQIAEAHERAYLLEALRRAGGNVTRAAELAGVSRRFIQRAMKRYALE